MSEEEARLVLFVRAVEEADNDGALLPQQVRAAASRALDNARDPLASDPVAPAAASTGTSSASRLVARARVCAEHVLRVSPALARLLEPRRLGFVTPIIVAVALVLGASSNLLGPGRHINVLGYPLAGLVAWNLAVYALLVWHHARELTGRGRRGLVAAAARRLEETRLTAITRRFSGSEPVAVTERVARRFQRLWVATLAPRLVARAELAMHLGALSLALGVVLGMYAAGIAVAYRATWESTWLDAHQVQTVLDLVLAPAASVLGRQVPDVGPLQGSAAGASAAPWIHLWAMTLALVVLAPRAVLAALAALRARRLRRRLPLDLRPAYYQRVLSAARGDAEKVTILYYSCDPEPRLRDRLRGMLHELTGVRAVIADGPAVAYGADVEEIAETLHEKGSSLFVVLFALAQTPEPEVHGCFLEHLQREVGRAGNALLVVLEQASYRRRVGADGRVRERRKAWNRLLRDAGLTAVDLDEPLAGRGHGAGSFVDAWWRAVWRGAVAGGGGAS